MLTKQALETRLAELQKARQQFEANVNALNGAIQLCQQLITEFDPPQEPEAKKE